MTEPERYTYRQPSVRDLDEGVWYARVSADHAGDQLRLDTLDYAEIVDVAHADGRAGIVARRADGSTRDDVVDTTAMGWQFDLWLREPHPTCGTCGALIFERYTGRSGSSRFSLGQTVWTHQRGKRPADGHRAAVPAPTRQGRS